MRNSPGSPLRHATPPTAKGKRPGLRHPAVHEPPDRSGVGPFTCNGDLDRARSSRTVRGVACACSTGLDGDVGNSAISGGAGTRLPSSVNTLGYDSDGSGPPVGFRSNDNHSAVRLVSHRDAAWAGGLFVAADIRP